MFYLPQYVLIPHLKRQEKQVIHQAVCPACGKKNVNLYWQSKQWQCRVCCELEKKMDGGASDG